MLTYDLNSRGKTPLYEYLYARIKADINSGILKTDYKLPSKRSLAQHLKISVITVENAYAQLALEGYIYSQEKRGYYVSPIETKGVKVNTVHPNIAKSKQDEETGFIDFRSNSVNPQKFPFSVWAKLMREVLSEQQEYLLRRIPNKGVYELRTAIADHLQAFRGINISPEQVIVGSGTEYLYGMLVKLLGQEKKFALENPGYKKISQIYSSSGVEYSLVNIDREGLSVAELELSGADVVHISPTHNFPTGIVMSNRRRREILDWSGRSVGRYIIEDDYDSELRLQGNPLPSLQSIDQQQKVIYMNTFTKTLAPSIRISYMILPPNLLDVYEQKLGFYACTVPSFEQYALAKFIADGYFERHIYRMRKFYKTQRNFLIKTIKNSRLQERMQIIEHSAGLHFLLKLSTNLSDKEIILAARKKGLLVSCLSEHCQVASTLCEPSTLVINYSGVDSEQIIMGIKYLEEIVCG